MHEDKFEGRVEAESWQQASPRWKGAGAIRVVHQLNEQYLGLICELAIERQRDNLWTFVEPNRDLWVRLDVPARLRIARLPFVLADIRFSDDEWWIQSTDTVSDSKGWRSKSATSRGTYEGVVLETLMFAWQLSREDRRISRMIFGASEIVADCIARCSMQQVRSMAQLSAEFVRIRWDGDRKFWRELLMSAIDEDEGSLDLLLREAKLLYCGSLIPRDR